MLCRICDLCAFSCFKGTTTSAMKSSARFIAGMNCLPSSFPNLGMNGGALVPHLGFRFSQASSSFLPMCWVTTRLNPSAGVLSPGRSSMNGRGTVSSSAARGMKAGSSAAGILPSIIALGLMGMSASTRSESPIRSSRRER